MFDRAGFAAATKKGIGLPIAGAAFWIAASAIFLLVPPKPAGFVVMVGTGLVFPLGILISRLLKGDIFAKEPPLSDLGGILAAVQLFYWPIIILCMLVFPVWLPFVLAVLFGSHFLPYGWLYQSRGYYFLGIAVPVVAAATALMGPSVSHAYTAPATAAIYVLGCAVVLNEVAALPPVMGASPRSMRDERQA
ncbi:MAG TPA: hypothetical protein VIL17_01950 [Coriobacteriia bacterium]